MSHYCPYCGEPIVFAHACHLAPAAKPASVEASPKHAYAQLDASDILKHIETKAQASQPTPCKHTKLQTFAVTECDLCGCETDQTRLPEAPPTPEPSAVLPWPAERIAAKVKGVERALQNGEYGWPEHADLQDLLSIITTYIHAPTPSSAPTGPEVERLVEAAEVVCYTSKGFPLAGAGFDELRSALAAFRKDRG